MGRVERRLGCRSSVSSETWERLDYVVVRGGSVMGVTREQRL